MRRVDRAGSPHFSPGPPNSVAEMLASPLKKALDLLLQIDQYIRNGYMLTPPVFHILLALAPGEKHGYGIMRDVATQTNGDLQLGPGTLYGCLKRMLAANLVEESDERPDPKLDDERRRYYRITDSGRHAVRAEARRLAGAVEMARSRRVLSHRKAQS